MPHCAPLLPQLVSHLPYNTIIWNPSALHRASQHVMPNSLSPERKGFRLEMRFIVAILAHHAICDKGSSIHCFICKHVASQRHTSNNPMLQLQINPKPYWSWYSYCSWWTSYYTTGRLLGCDQGNLQRWIYHSFHGKSLMWAQKATQGFTKQNKYLI